MMGKRRMLAAGGAACVFSLGLMLVAGCNKGSDSTPSGPPGGVSDPTGGRPPGLMGSGGPGGGPGGPGGMRGGPGGPGGPGRRGGFGGGPGGPRGGPVAANASGSEILQAKCGCHGPGGKGGNAPTLVGGAGKSDDDLFKIIHDGKGKMPAFASQLSDDQIKKVVAEMKGLK